MVGLGGQVDMFAPRVWDGAATLQVVDEEPCLKCCVVGWGQGSGSGSSLGVVRCGVRAYLSLLMD